MNDQLLISKVKKSPFEKGSTRVGEGEGFKIPRPDGHRDTPFYKGGLKTMVVLTIVVVGGYLLPLPVLALDYVPLAPLPGTTVTEGGKEVVRNAGDYIKGAFNLAIGIAAALAIIMIIVGGIQYMGTESIGGKGAGLKKIKDAVLGLLLALGSYVILLTINPALVEFNLNIAPITSPTAPLVTPPANPTNWILAYVVIVGSQLNPENCTELGPGKFTCLITNSPTTRQECELKYLQLDRVVAIRVIDPTPDLPLGTILSVRPCRQI